VFVTLAENEVYSYPNPNAGEANIRFPLAAPAEIHIEIQDINGKHVWSKAFSAAETFRGINRVTWYGVNDLGQQVGNGIYLLVISAENKTVKKKIAIIR